MSLLTKGVGQLILDVIALSAIDPDCNSSTPATISWTDLGETYQLERSTDATNWTVIYTGTAFTRSETGLANTDQQYFYRVKVVGDTVYSNIGYFQIWQQNKFLRDDGCWPSINVDPYQVRKAYRQNCGETYTYTVDEARCKAGTGGTVSFTIEFVRTANDGETCTDSGQVWMEMAPGFVPTAPIGTFVSSPAEFTCVGSNHGNGGCTGGGIYVLHMDGYCGGGYCPGGCTAYIHVTGYTVT